MRAGLAGVLCCVLLLGACRAPLEDGDDLQAARTAIAERQWSRAERLLGRYLRDERKPELRWQAWNALLTVLEAGGDPRTNLDYLDAMLEEFADDDAKSREILLRIGRLNERLRRYDRAADTWIAYLNVAGLPPEDSLYGYRRLGAMLFHLRRFEAAEEALQQCLALPLPDEAKSMCTYDLADQYLARGSWNEAADTAVLAGDKIEVINAPAKLNKYGDVELSVGRGSVLREREEEGVYLEFEGFVIPRSEGLTIDNGTEALLLVTDQPLTPAQRIRDGGICKSSRLYAERIETVPVSAADLRERLKNL